MESYLQIHQTKYYTLLKTKQKGDNKSIRPIEIHKKERRSCKVICDEEWKPVQSYNGHTKNINANHRMTIVCSLYGKYILCKVFKKGSRTTLVEIA